MKVSCVNSYNNVCNPKNVSFGELADNYGMTRKGCYISLLDGEEKETVPVEALPVHNYLCLKELKNQQDINALKIKALQKQVDCIAKTMDYNTRVIRDRL